MGRLHQWKLNTERNAGRLLGQCPQKNSCLAIHEKPSRTDAYRKYAGDWNLKQQEKTEMDGSD